MLLLPLLFAICFAHYGIDVSEDVNIESLKCILNNGYRRTIVRAYRSDNSVDSAAPHTIYNALDAGMSLIDIYLFPCPHCSAASDQVSAMLSYLASYNISFSGSGIQLNQLWLDIEDTSNHDYWGSDSQSNAGWMSDLYSAAVSAVGSDRVGVYSNINNWNTIFADSSFNCCSNAKLWYPAYGLGPSFSDFQAFAGWTTPFGKQYSGSGNVCGVSVDESYFNTGAGPLAVEGKNKVSVN
jgi:hypothetical protein